MNVTERLALGGNQPSHASIDHSHLHKRLHTNHSLATDQSAPKRSQTGHTVSPATTERYIQSTDEASPGVKSCAQRLVGVAKTAVEVAGFHNLTNPDFKLEIEGNRNDLKKIAASGEAWRTLGAFVVPLPPPVLALAPVVMSYLCPVAAGSPVNNTPATKGSATAQTSEECPLGSRKMVEAKAQWHDETLSVIRELNGVGKDVHHSGSSEDFILKCTDENFDPSDCNEVYGGKDGVYPEQASACCACAQVNGKIDKNNKCFTTFLREKQQGFTGIYDSGSDINTLSSAELESESKYILRPFNETNAPHCTATVIGKPPETEWTCPGDSSSIKTIETQLRHENFNSLTKKVDASQYKVKCNTDFTAGPCYLYGGKAGVYMWRSSVCCACAQQRGEILEGNTCMVSEQFQGFGSGYPFQGFYDPRSGIRSSSSRARGMGFIVKPCEAPASPASTSHSVTMPETTTPQTTTLESTTPKATTPQTTTLESTTPKATTPQTTILESTTPIATTTQSTTLESTTPKATPPQTTTVLGGTNNQANNHIYPNEELAVLPSSATASLAASTSIGWLGGSIAIGAIGVIGAVGIYGGCRLVTEYKKGFRGKELFTETCKSMKDGITNCLTCKEHCSSENDGGFSNPLYKEGSVHLIPKKNNSQDFEHKQP